MIKENFYILFSKSKDKIKGSLIFRIDKNQEKKYMKLMFLEKRASIRLIMIFW